MSIHTSGKTLQTQNRTNLELFGKQVQHINMEEEGNIFLDFSKSRATGNTERLLPAPWEKNAMEDDTQNSQQERHDQKEEKTPVDTGIQGNTMIAIPGRLPDKSGTKNISKSDKNINSDNPNINIFWRCLLSGSDDYRRRSSQQGVSHHGWKGEII